MMMQDENGNNINGGNTEPEGVDAAAGEFTDLPDGTTEAEPSNLAEPSETAADEFTDVGAEGEVAPAEEMEDAAGGPPEGSTQLEVRDAADVEAEQEEEEDLPEPYVPKLNEKQQKMWQIILGLICGFGIMFSLWAGSLDRDNKLLGWLFLIVFAGVMVGKNQVEKRTGVYLGTFMKFLLISLAAGLGIFVLWGVATGQFTK